MRLSVVVVFASGVSDKVVPFPIISGATSK